MHYLPSFPRKMVQWFFVTTIHNKQWYFWDELFLNNHSWHFHASKWGNCTYLRSHRSENELRRWTWFFPQNWQSWSLFALHGLLTELVEPMYFLCIQMQIFSGNTVKSGSCLHDYESGYLDYSSTNSCNVYIWMAITNSCPVFYII